MLDDFGGLDAGSSETALATRRELQRAATVWFSGLLLEDLRRERLAWTVDTSAIDLWTLLDAAAGECAVAIQIVNRC